MIHAKDRQSQRNWSDKPRQGGASRFDSLMASTPPTEQNRSIALLPAPGCDETFDDKRKDASRGSSDANVGFYRVSITRIVFGGDPNIRADQIVFSAWSEFGSMTPDIIRTEFARASTIPKTSSVLIESGLSTPPRASKTSSAASEISGQLSNSCRCWVFMPLKFSNADKHMASSSVMNLSSTNIAINSSSVESPERVSLVMESKHKTMVIVSAPMRVKPVAGKTRGLMLGSLS